VAVGLAGKKRDVESLQELSELAMSAGMDPVTRMACQRAKADAAFFVGDGKAQEIADLIAQESIHTVIFDHELSASQHRNLEQRWRVEVVDRTELILEIFAGRARSHDGKLQVELARLEHLASRIVRGWTHLERQKGGIGLRGGPGEKQVELDRRMLGDRLKKLKAKLATIEKQRKTQRRSRDKSNVFTVALVGYTNAGKSTLFSALTRADTYVADQLFATLDTLTRQIRFDAQSPELAISDTVGFIRQLPHQLVAAFKATLDETAQADLLLHVVDASSPHRDDQIEQVNLVLEDIGAANVPTILVYNKIDATNISPRIERDERDNIVKIFVSARDRIGLDLLKQTLVQAAIEHRHVVPELSPLSHSVNFHVENSLESAAPHSVD
jgi:GTPase